MDSAELVKKMISEHRIMVFSKSFCPFCKKAKSALDSVLKDSSKYTVMELDSRDDGPAIQDALAAMTGGRSVPRVFIDAEFIGGGDETAALAASGKLEEMVKAKAII